MATRAMARPRWSPERRFYTGMALAILAVVYAGFARSFFLRPFFPDWPSPPEPIFYVHGAVFAAWCVLLVAQTTLVAVGRTARHRTLGSLGAGLAVLMIVLGVRGALAAARRPGGFIGIDLPPLQFLVVPLTDIVLFSTFVGLGLATRRNPRAHKRWMLLATLNLLAAAVARLPGVSEFGPLAYFGLTNLFLVAMVVWDRRSRGAMHPVTLWGGAVFVLSQPLRLALSTTPAWMAFARWAVG